MANEDWLNQLAEDEYDLELIRTPTSQLNMPVYTTARRAVYVSRRSPPGTPTPRR